jgi:hypothetical protein
MKPQLIESGRESRVREQQRAWYLANAEKKKAYARQYYRLNKETCIEAAKAYRVARPEVTLASRLKCNYGITVEKYQEMLKEQNNMCAICDIELSNKDKKTTPHVDHSHKTGEVRGILCLVCNTKISVLEMPEFLAKAYSYLGRA